MGITLAKNERPANFHVSAMDCVWFTGACLLNGKYFGFMKLLQSKDAKRRLLNTEEKFPFWQPSDRVQQIQSKHILFLYNINTTLVAKIINPRTVVSQIFPYLFNHKKKTKKT